MSMRYCLTKKNQLVHEEKRACQQTDTYHASLLPGKFADVQQVSLAKEKQLVHKLGGQFVPFRVHDEPCCAE